MKNKTTHKKWFSSCENGRLQIHPIKVSKYKIMIEASVPAMLKVLQMNKRWRKNLFQYFVEKKLLICTDIIY